MPITDTLTRQARVIALNKGRLPVHGAAQETFVFEDGWVFREHHGKYVECICRFEEFSSATSAPAQHAR
jgi:hypothetical protein